MYRGICNATTADVVHTVFFFIARYLTDVTKLIQLHFLSDLTTAAEPRSLGMNPALGYTAVIRNN
jgi:hypothetical protein